jgi:predicted MFS family arabinose efflux permease
MAASHPHESDENVTKSVGLPKHNHHHGISLIPRPSQDVKDPLRWPRWLKIVALIATSMTNFTANFIGAGLSVATPILQQQFRKSATTVNMLLTFNFLFLALGNLLWVPLGAKFGKRPVLLLAYGLLVPIMIWSAKATTFSSLLAARSLTGLVSSAGEVCPSRQ